LVEPRAQNQGLLTKGFKGYLTTYYIKDYYLPKRSGRF